MSAPTPVRIVPATPADAPALFALVNAAYMVESGDDGVAFKNSLRFVSLAEAEDMLRHTQVASAVDEGGALLGCISYAPANDAMYFGPLAVSPAAQGRGVASALMGHVERAARHAGLGFLEITVVNWRTDVLPMYAARGFVVVGEAPFPEPSRLTRPSHFFVMRRPLVGGGTAAAPSVPPLLV